MADEIRATYDTGETLYVLVFRQDGQVWDQTLAVGAGAWTPFNTPFLDNYDVELTEIDDVTDNSGQYRGDFPPNIETGSYSVVCYLQLEGVPEITDEHIGATATMHWNTVANLEYTDTTTGGTVAEILTDTGTTLPIEHSAIPGATRNLIINDATPFSGADIAAILTDTDTTLPADHAATRAYILSDVIGADSDTLETLSDQLDFLGAGAGGTEEIYTVTDSTTGLPIDGVHVWVTTDIGGANIIWAGYTNAAGIVKYYHDLATGTTVYLWRELAGYRFTNPDSENTS